jgi:hypothetical protein
MLSTRPKRGDVAGSLLAQVIGHLKQIDRGQLQDYKNALKHPEQFSEFLRGARYQHLCNQMNACRSAYNQALAIMLPLPIEGDSLVQKIQDILSTQVMHRSDVNYDELIAKLNDLIDIYFPIFPADELKADHIPEEEIHLIELALAVRACTQDRIKKKIMTHKNDAQYAGSSMNDMHIEWLLYKVKQIAFWYSVQGTAMKVHQADVHLLLNLLGEIERDASLCLEKKFFTMANEIKSIWNQEIAKYKKNNDTQMIQFLNENPKKHGLLRDIGALLQACAKLCARAKMTSSLCQREWGRVYFSKFATLDLWDPKLNGLTGNGKVHPEPEVVASIKDQINRLESDSSLASHLQMVVSSHDSFVSAKICSLADSYLEIMSELSRIDSHGEKESKKLFGHSDEFNDDHLLGEIKKILNNHL